MFCCICSCISSRSPSILSPLPLNFRKVGNLMLPVQHRPRRWISGHLKHAKRQSATPVEMIREGRVQDHQRSRWTAHSGPRTASHGGHRERARDTLGAVLRRFRVRRRRVRGRGGHHRRQDLAGGPEGGRVLRRGVQHQQIFDR